MMESEVLFESKIINQFISLSVNDNINNNNNDDGTSSGISTSNNDEIIMTAEQGANSSKVLRATSKITTLLSDRQDEMKEKKMRINKGGEHKSTIVLSLTKNILDTYKKCKPGNFHYVKALQRPRRLLTKDAQPAGNFGFDNRQCDLILTVGDSITNPTTGQQYKIVDMLGQGTFGQVVKCRTTTMPDQTANRLHDRLMSLEFNQPRTNSENAVPKEIPSMVAIKVVKNKPAYSNQAKVEIKILDKLVRAYEKSDPSTKHYHDHLIHMIDSFQFHSHMCIVFELMSINLFELIKQNDFRGLAMREISSFGSQILAALKVLDELQIVHCDIKPENILIENFSNPPRVKLVDFGSACFENHTLYTYIQSRFYRAPEVIVGLPYSKQIDIWSFGCIMVELFMGLPVFPGASNHNQLLRIEETLGEFPEWILEQGKQTKKFYNKVLVRSQGADASYTNYDAYQTDFNRNRLESEYDEDIYEQRIENLDDLLDSPDSRAEKEIGEKKYKYKWIIKTSEEYAFDENLPAAEKMKRYCKDIKLPDIIMKCDSKRRPNGESVADVDRNVLKSFLSFITGLLKLDPNERTTVNDAIQHPFISSPTMVEPAASKRPNSFRMASPMLTPSLMSPGSFYNTPFSPPIRPGVPYPLAHEWPNTEPQTPSYNPFYREYDDPRLSLETTDTSQEENFQYLIGESAYFNNPTSGVNDLGMYNMHNLNLDQDEGNPYVSQADWSYQENDLHPQTVASIPPGKKSGDNSASSSLNSSGSAILPLLRTSSYHDEMDSLPLLNPLPTTIRGASISDTEIKPHSISHTLLHNGSIPMSIAQPNQTQHRMWAPSPTSTGATASSLLPSSFGDANSRTPRLNSDAKLLKRVFNSSSSLNEMNDSSGLSSNDSDESLRDANLMQENHNIASRSSSSLRSESPHVQGISPRPTLSELYGNKRPSPRRRKSAFSRLVSSGSSSTLSSSPANSPMESRSRLPPLPPAQPLSLPLPLSSSHSSAAGYNKRFFSNDDGSYTADTLCSPTHLDLNHGKGSANSQSSFYSSTDDDEDKLKM